MKQATVQITGQSPYSPGKYLDAVKGPTETHQALEDRVWRDRVNCDDKGNVFIPPMAIKNALLEAAKMLGRPLPGRGKCTFAKIFKTGTMVINPLFIGSTKEQAVKNTLLVPSDGRSGGTTRVKKNFPLFTKWSGVATIEILADSITESVLREHIEFAGTFVGFGTFRPQSGGYFGRFTVGEIKIK